VHCFAVHYYYNITSGYFKGIIGCGAFLALFVGKAYNMLDNSNILWYNTNRRQRKQTLNRRKKMKILKIEDTREYEEGPNDRWIAIAGSGILNQCERCNKDHEVHITVQDGEKVYTVGTGCAKKENMISDKQAKSGNSTAKTIAKWQAIIESLTPKAIEWDNIYEEEQGAYARAWELAAQENKQRNPYSRKYSYYNCEVADRVADQKARQRLDILQTNHNPAHLLEKAQKSLSRAEKKMATIING
jgi:hypothetical protein